MQKAILIIFFTLASLSLSAQHSFGPSVFAGYSGFINKNASFEFHEFFSPLFIAGVGFNYEYSLNDRSRLVSGLNFNAKGNKVTFNGGIGINPANVMRSYYLSFQVPLLYQHRFRSGKNNAWLVAAGVSANYTTAKLNSYDTEDGFSNETSDFKKKGNVFMPGVLVNIGYSQSLKKERAIVYSLVYDQNLDTYYPDHYFYGFSIYNLGVSVCYLFSHGK